LILPRAGLFDGTDATFDSDADDESEEEEKQAPPPDTQNPKDAKKKAQKKPPTGGVSLFGGAIRKGFFNVSARLQCASL